MLKYVVFGLLVASALAVPTPTAELNCANEEDLLGCLAVKAATTLQRAARSAEVNLVDGVSFVKDTPVERTARAMVQSETELMKELPRDGGDKTAKLATMLYEAAESFLKSHSLKLDLPQARTLDEGKKSKKIFFPLMAAAALKLLALVPIFFGGLVILVTKALFVGKIALLVAGVLAFQRFFGAGAGVGAGPGAILGGNFFGRNPGYNAYAESSAYSPVAQPQGYNYKRSFNEKPEVAAQQLAYAAQMPAENVAQAN